MTEDRDAAAAADRPGAWHRDLQTLSDRDTSPLTEATRLRDLAERRPRGRPGTDPRPSSGGPSGTASPLVESIRRAADFDDLRLEGSPADYRYGRAVGVRARVDGRACDLQLRLLRRPDDGEPFRDALLDQLDRWAAVSDLDGVVPLLDGSGRPRPWACTAPVETTLADHPPETLADALRTARSLSGTLASLHDRGVLHTGLDPSHVVAPPGDDPLLDSVGLFDVYRRYGDPANALALPYAPPEYFDDRYGIADRATDVYGLGAVLFYLFTGRPPYDGSAAAIREAVLTEPFPRPSAVADFAPEAIDDVVARATAVDPFDRYRSVAALSADVEEICLELLGEA